MKAQKDLTSGPLLWQIITFSVPVMLSSVLQLLFNTADTVVVGRFGGDTVQECETALAAVGSCGALVALIVSMFMGLAVGSGVGVAQNIGARKDTDVDEIVHTSVALAIVLGVMTTVVGFLFAPKLLILMGTAPSVLGQATLYIKAFFTGTPGNMMYNYCAAMLRSRGDTEHPLLFLTIAGVVNVILNLLLVIIFDLGAMGVGIATAVSHWISGLLTLAFMIRLDGYCHVSLRKMHIYPDKLKMILRIGLPAGLQGMVFSVSNVLIQSSVNSFGQVIMAANAASANLCNYVYNIQNSVYHAAITFVGQNLGAGDKKRVKQSMLYCVIVVTAFGVISSAVLLIFSKTLLGFFIKDNPAVMEAGLIRLKIIGTTQVICGIMEVGCGVLRGLGYSFRAMIYSLAGSCLLRIIWIKTVFAGIHTLECLYFSYPVSWVATACAHFLFCAMVFRWDRTGKKPLIG